MMQKKLIKKEEQHARKCLECKVTESFALGRCNRCHKDDLKIYFLRGDNKCEPCWKSVGLHAFYSNLDQGKKELCPFCAEITTKTYVGTGIKCYKCDKVTKMQPERCQKEDCHSLFV